MKKLEREPNKTRILSACVDAKSQIYPREGPGLHSLRLPIHRHVSFIKFLSPSTMCNLNAFSIELSCHLSNAHVVRIPFTVFFFACLNYYCPSQIARTTYQRQVDSVRTIPETLYW